MSVAAPPGSHYVDVWLARESLADQAETAARFRTLLSDDERERNAKMLAESPRRLHLVARALQRTVLSRYEPGVAPREWRFASSPSGRPSLAPPYTTCGLHFNLAHTRGLVAMAIGRVPSVGVDIERRDKPVPIAVAKRYFSEHEVAALLALPPEQQAARFLRLWTLKESYLKATGIGIAGGLAHTTFTFDEKGGLSFERADDPHASRWVFREFNPAGYQLALAYLDPAATAAPEPALHEYLGELT